MNKYEDISIEINENVIKLFNHIKNEVLQGNLKGILNYTPSYNKLIINFDLEKINSSKIIDFLKSIDFSKLSLSQDSKKYKIPTAKFGIFKSYSQAIEFLKKTNMPIVVKADGLAAGKGVYICEKFESAIKAVDEIFNGKFGTASQLLIEEFLDLGSC